MLCYGVCIEPACLLAILLFLQQAPRFIFRVIWACACQLLQAL